MRPRACKASHAADYPLNPPPVTQRCAFTQTSAAWSTRPCGSVSPPSVQSALAGKNRTVSTVCKSPGVFSPALRHFMWRRNAWNDFIYYYYLFLCVCVSTEGHCCFPSWAVTPVNNTTANGRHQKTNCGIFSAKIIYVSTLNDCYFCVIISQLINMFLIPWIISLKSLRNYFVSKQLLKNLQAFYLL